MPPTPLRSDDFFSEGDASIGSPSKAALTRPSDLSLTQTTSTSSSDPLTVAPGPTSCALAPTLAGAEDTALVSYAGPHNDRRAVSESGKETEELKAGQEVVLQKCQREDEALDMCHGTGREEKEEEEEMTEERLQSLLDDIKMEGGLEDEEMTEERMNAILEQVRQAEKDVCSVPGWRSDASGAVGGSPAPDHDPGTEEGR